LVTSSLFAAGLQARLDRTRLAEGDTLILSLSAPGNSSGAPDLSPLEQDFDILNQSQSSRMSIINGNTSSTREWQLVLAPKHSGKLHIPPLSLAGMTSQALSVEVLPAAQAAKLGEPRPLALEVEASPKDPYVQGEVIYTLRVLARVSLRQASLSEPTVKDALIERLGEDKQYTDYRDGQQYQVIERRYAIFPQHSGKLEIEAPLLSAQVPESGQRRQSLRQRMFGDRDPFANMQDLFGRDPFTDMGGLFGQTRPVQVRGRNLTLQVRPQPAEAASPWLPAESLSLAESWSPDPPVFRVGEPVTRTITITAQGLSAAQLPDLSPRVPKGVKVYPDKPQSETRTEDGALVARKVLKSALLPSRAGELTLPEVRLSWWDTRTNQQKRASLPARKVQVLPAAGGVTEPQVPASAAAPELGSSDTPEAATAPSVATVPVENAVDSMSRLGQNLIQRSHLSAGYWPWLTALLALAWLVSTGLWLRARAAASSTRGVPPERPNRSPVPQPGKALNRLQRACQTDDAKAARQALLEWGAARWPEDPPRRLEILGRRLDNNVVELLRALDQELYAPASQGWDGAEVWHRLAPVLKRSNQENEITTRDGVLPPLYQQSV
jgi:hypothetical protein